MGKLFGVFVVLLVIVEVVQCQCATPSTITSYSQGTAFGIPDTATLTILLTNTSSSATLATRNIRSTLNQLLRITDWNNIPMSSISILNIDLSTLPSSLFQANQTLLIQHLSITSPTTSLVATLYQQFTKLSGVQLSGLKFEHSNMEGVKDQARRNAFGVADSYVQMYGLLAGFHGNSLVEVREEGEMVEEGRRLNVTEVVGWRAAEPGVYRWKVRVQVKYMLI